MNYEVYTDGACSGNPGPAGWAVVIIPENRMALSTSGYLASATNNRAELLAIVRALKILNNRNKIVPPNKYTINIYSDSAYCLNPINENWIKSWEARGWKTSSYTPVKNADLWMELREILNNTKYIVNFIKVQGHTGNRYNEEADRLAKEAIIRFKESLKDGSKTN